MANTPPSGGGGNGSKSGSKKDKTSWSDIVGLPSWITGLGSWVSTAKNFFKNPGGAIIGIILSAIAGWFLTLNRMLFAFIMILAGFEYSPGENVPWFGGRDWNLFSIVDIPGYIVGILLDIWWSVLYLPALSLMQTLIDLSEAAAESAGPFGPVVIVAIWAAIVIGLGSVLIWASKAIGFAIMSRG